MGIRRSGNYRYMGGEGSERADISGFMMRKMTNKVDRLHLIFNSNSITYAETYVVPTEWLNLSPSITLHNPLPIPNIHSIKIRYDGSTVCTL